MEIIANDNERENSEKTRLGWVPNRVGKQCYEMVNKFIRALWGEKTLPKGEGGEIGNPIITTDKKNVVNERIKENEFKLRIQF